MPLPPPAHLRHRRESRDIQGRARLAHGAIFRGVVLNTYLPDDPKLVGKVGAAPNSLAGPVCDVLVFEPRSRALLRGVPVMRLHAGLNDYELYVPTPTSQSIRGGTLLVNSAGELLPTLRTTKVTDFDGDFVLVGFLSNDLNQPIILGQVDHPGAKKRPSFTDVTKFKRRVHVRGVSAGVTQSGNAEIDLSGAGSVQAANGALTPDPAAGNLDIKLSATARVQINGGGVSEGVILGRTFLSDLVLGLTEVQAGLAGLGIPTTNLASAVAKINTALAAGAPYLSTNLKTD